jgi:hypothetical protein
MPTAIADGSCVEGPIAMVRWTYIEDMLRVLGAMMVLLPLAALGLFIALMVFL